MDENPKVQWFLNYLPFHIKDKIEYDNPKTLEEAMRKANFAMSRTEKGKACQTRRLRDLIILNIRRRVSYLTAILGIITQHNFPNKNFQGNKGNSQLNPNGTRNEEPTNNHSNYIKNNERKEPLKCWECNGPHYASIFITERRLSATYTWCKRR